MGALQACLFRVGGTLFTRSMLFKKEPLIPPLPPCPFSRLVLVLFLIAHHQEASMLVSCTGYLTCAFQCQVQNCSPHVLTSRTSVQIKRPGGWAESSSVSLKDWLFINLGPPFLMPFFFGVGFSLQDTHKTKAIPELGRRGVCEGEIWSFLSATELCPVLAVQL